MKCLRQMYKEIRKMPKTLLKKYSVGSVLESAVYGHNKRRTKHIDIKQPILTSKIMRNDKMRKNDK